MLIPNYPTGQAPPHFLNLSSQGSQLEPLFTLPSNQSETASKFSPKPKNSNFFAQVKNHSHASRIHRSTDRCHATQQKGNHHFRHAQHQRLVMIWD
ncbi:hypothetical protein TNCV_1134111 [Trichonephila clavipes]|nr:hypothetical protein TNCV_1134111 [Trichonephila clavipes]